jgi:hypothetical protein
MFAQRLADIYAFGGQKSVGHATANHQHVHFGNEVLQKVDFGRHLSAAYNSQNRADGFTKRGAECY